VFSFTVFYFGSGSGKQVYIYCSDPAHCRKAAGAGLAKNKSYDNTK
jgi:hypothetical protein